MSNEVKFRAWFELINKMVHPENLALHYEGEDGFGFAFDLERADEEGNVPGTLNFKLMQLTGLKDKNGQGIYDRDIIRNDRGTILKVIFVDGAF